MAHPSWLNALKEACYHAHDPRLHYDSEEEIIFGMLYQWEDHPTPIPPFWRLSANLMHKYDTSSVEDIFVLLQRAIREGNEDDRAFALILLGTLATPKALDIVRSFLSSPSLKERWASAITLGRHKEACVFPLLQTFLLDGFLVSPPFASKEEAEKQTESQDTYPPIGDQSVAVEYDWSMHQRWECALVLGAWGNPCVVPRLREALDTAWKMEQMGPNYMGFADGPEIWHAFQDRLAFALGQLGAWHVLLDLDLPENRLLIATIYLALGALQVQDASIFYLYGAEHLFSLPPSVLGLATLSVEKQESIKQTQESRLAKLPVEKQEHIKHMLANYHVQRKERWLATHPFVEPARVKQLLSRHLGFSEAEQEHSLQRFPHALARRDKKSPPCPRQQWSGQSDTFDPFLDSGDLP